MYIDWDLSFYYYTGIVAYFLQAVAGSVTSFLILRS
jgi:hypothetical protein